MPTFINLPPPYSEQPSPLYNLCASSSISSTTTISCCQMSLSADHVGHQPLRSCCMHHVTTTTTTPPTAVCLAGGNCNSTNETANQNYLYGSNSGHTAFQTQNQLLLDTDGGEGAAINASSILEPNNNSINLNNVNNNANNNET